MSETARNQDEALGQYLQASDDITRLNHQANMAGVDGPSPADPQTVEGLRSAQEASYETLVRASMDLPSAEGLSDQEKTVRQELLEIQAMQAELRNMVIPELGEGALGEVIRRLAGRTITGSDIVAEILKFHHELEDQAAAVNVRLLRIGRVASSMALGVRTKLLSQERREAIAAAIAKERQAAESQPARREAAARAPEDKYPLRAAEAAHVLIADGGAMSQAELAQALFGADDDSHKHMISVIMGVAQKYASVSSLQRELQAHGYELRVVGIVVSGKAADAPGPRTIAGYQAVRINPEQ